VRSLAKREGDTVRRWIGWLVVATLCGTVMAPRAVGRAYALYHDSTEGRSTAIVLTNLDDSAITAQVSAFDANGDEVAGADVSLAAFASEAVFLTLDAGIGGASGLVRVETAGRIALSAWYAAGEEWLAVENATGSVLVVEEYAYTGYWLTMNYANTASRMTSLSLVNPYDELLRGEMYVYSEAGKRVSTHGFELDSRTTAVISLDQDLEDPAWGMVDVHCDAPVLLVTEYFDAAGELIDLDLVSSVYLLDP